MGTGTVGGLLLASTLAQAAQPGGVGGPGSPLGPAGAPPTQRTEEKEGPAEEAPDDKEALRPVERVPALPRLRRRLQLFELDGYFRMRADYFHRLNMGLDAVIEEDERPIRFFPPPSNTLEEDDPFSCVNRLEANGVAANRARTRCRRRNGLSGANLRLRLEPTLHVTDTVSVHAQIDVLDNVVLGSTPDALGRDDPWAPIDLFTRTQVPPEETGAFNQSIVAKRAWGAIQFGWGLGVQFGRMPWSWGMGLVANHGNGYARGDQADIIRSLDRDYGDSVDSVRLTFDFGRDRRRTHQLIASWDWAATGPTTAQLLGLQWASGGTIGQAFSVERFDNVYQWQLGILRRDDEDMLRRKIALGQPVVNYGATAWVRWQDLDDAAGSGFYNPDPFDPEFGADNDSDYEALSDYGELLVPRRAVVATPDLWLRVNWRTLRFELEAAGTFGTFRVRDLDVETTDLTALDSDSLGRKVIATFGYALEFKYGLFHDRFHIGFDHGFATGDSATPRNGNPLAALNQYDNRNINNFRFNPAYNVDLLLFREVLGTVSNATYFKPWAAFYFFDHFSARADVMYALAPEPAATPGRNRFSYGIEVDGGLRYHDAREPIFFQLQYGVLFPLGAFDRVLDEPERRREDARAVQSVQAQLGIRF